MRMLGVLLCVTGLGCGSTASPDAGTDAGRDVGAVQGHFTYGVGDRVYRLEARVGATPQDVSAALERFGAGTRDRWLIPSPNGAWLALSTDRLPCSMGECLALAPADLSSLSLINPGGAEVSLEGTPAVTDDGATIVFPSQDGPHEVDLWVSHRSGSAWTAATLLTGTSSAAYNNMPALSLDGRSVLFDCGAQPYPESGGNDACRVALDGSALQVVVRSTTLPNARQDFVQFPHDSIDGVLFQAAWPIDADAPETIWLLASGGTPSPIGRGLSNAVSPCGLRDGRWGVLWLSRPGNAAGLHELTLMARDGALLGALTPGVDVADIGIGCSD